MSAQPAPSPLALPSARDFLNPETFLSARRDAWSKVSTDLDPNGGLADLLDAYWLREWMGAHAENVKIRIKATANLSNEEIVHYTSLGGLAGCVAELVKQEGRLAVQATRIDALEQALRSIASYRHANTGRLSPEQMLDKIALIAHEMTTYGHAAAEEQVQDDVAGDPPAVDGETEVRQQGQDAPTISDQAVSAPAGESAGGQQTGPRKGVEIMTAQRFMAMAGVRSLKMVDGEAYASDGQTYDAGRRLDPERPLPGGVSHIAWLEYAAQP